MSQTQRKNSLSSKIIVGLLIVCGLASLCIIYFDYTQQLLIKVIAVLDSTDFIKSLAVSIFTLTFLKGAGYIYNFFLNKKQKEEYILRQKNANKELLDTFSHIIPDNQFILSHDLIKYVIDAVALKYDLQPSELISTKDVFSYIVYEILRTPYLSNEAKQNYISVIKSSINIKRQATISKNIGFETKPSVNSHSMDLTIVIFGTLLSAYTATIILFNNRSTGYSILIDEKIIIPVAIFILLAVIIFLNTFYIHTKKDLSNLRKIAALFPIGLMRDLDEYKIKNGIPQIFVDVIIAFNRFTAKNEISFFNKSLNDDYINLKHSARQLMLYITDTTTLGKQGEYISEKERNEIYTRYYYEKGIDNHFSEEINILKNNFVTYYKDFLKPIEQDKIASQK